MDSSQMILIALTVIAGSLAFEKDPSLLLAGLYASGRLFGSVWLELL